MQTAKNIEPTDQPELQLVHRIKLWQGIFKPTSHFSTLRDAEQVKGLIWRVLLISLLAGIFTGFTTYLTMELNIIPNQKAIPGMDTAIMQNIVAISAGVGGLFTLPVYMLIAAAIYTIIFRDIPFGKQFAIQAYASFISLINIAIAVPSLYLAKTVTPFFSLGIIGEALHAGPFLQALLSTITVFFIWQLIFTIIAIKQTTTKSSKYVVSWILILNVIYLFISAAIFNFSTAVSNLSI